MRSVLLVILDGFGEGPAYEGNAITAATLTTLPNLRKTCLFTTLKAAGEAVGVPNGTQGGSEVGHFTIGAGRVVFQTYEMINRSIRDKSFFKKPALVEACERAKKNEKAALHLLGMISDQGIHSHIAHLFALLELARDQKVPKIFIHAITDGRDVHERSADGFITQIETKIKELKLEGIASIATLVGRYYAMDRDCNWERLSPAHDLLTCGIGRAEKNAHEAVQHAYERGITTDYYIDPVILDPGGTIKDTDSVIFFNSRSDRARELTWAFTGEDHIQKPDSLPFVPSKIVRPFFVCLGPYSAVAPVVFPTPAVKNNLGEVISKAGLKQFRISETQKYAHVTYFFNSQIEPPLPGEDRLMVESPKCTSYGEKPEMSAHELTQKLIEKMKSGGYKLIVANFANCDLVGHSGDMPAAKKAVETIDECLGKIIAAADETDFTTLITGDHGKIEYMVYEDGSPCPSHTKNPVPFIAWGKDLESYTVKKTGGELKDIAPTILDLMDIEKPSEMEGESLFIKENR